MRATIKIKLAYIAITLLLALNGCSKNESPVVTQARAAVNIAQLDVDRAQQELNTAQAEQQAARDAVAQIEADPALQGPRQAVAEAQRRLEENHRLYNANATHERAMEGVSLGGQLVVARNALQAAERPLSAAQARVRQAIGRVNHAQEVLRGAEAEVARKRLVLSATESAAR